MLYTDFADFIHLRSSALSAGVIYHMESRQGLKLGRIIAAPVTTHSVRNVPKRNGTAVFAFFAFGSFLTE
jgi:hypothetical protein